MEGWKSLRFSVCHSELVPFLTYGPIMFGLHYWRGIDTGKRKIMGMAFIDAGKERNQLFSPSKTFYKKLLGVIPEPRPFLIC